MPTLYVTEPGTVVRLTEGQLRVTGRDGGEDNRPANPVRASIKAHRLERIALLGHTHITSDAMQFCLRRGIGVAWFNHSGECLGRVTPTGNLSAEARLGQYGCCTDPMRALELARIVVAAKIDNAAAVLVGLQRNEPGRTGLSEAIAQLRQLRVQAAAAPGSDTLLGLEGTAARTYFQSYGAMFKAEITFQGRKKRPAPDPANALLSFAYTLLGNRIAGAIEAQGLDPALGFFHDIRSGRPSLALDLLEELRHPIVDRFVLRACNLRTFQPGMFTRDPEHPGGMRMTREGLKAFFRAWEERLRTPHRETGESAAITPEDLIPRQVDRIAGAFRHGVPYQPYRFEG